MTPRWIPVPKQLDERVYHRPPSGLGFLAVGAIVAVVAAILIYLAFAKSLPFGGGYELNATFESTATLRSDAPVRIAGVNVGEVTDVRGKGDAAEVTFTVDDSARPIHEDATIKIRPRLFLEGNFFLDLRPGSPSAPELADGGAIPITNTSLAVQFDEILTTLQRSDRGNLSKLLRGLGTALTYEPTAADDADQDPDVEGESAAEALNDTFAFGGRAGRDTAIVNEALLGEGPHDLSRLIRGQERVFRALADRSEQLGELIVNLDTTAGAFAQEAANLRLTLRELAPTLEDASPSLRKLNKTFPPLRRFAGALRPGVRQLPATIEAGTPWLRQANALLARRELGGLADQLRRATPGLARTAGSGAGLFRQSGLTGVCASDVLVPAGDAVIDDQFATGAPNYRDFFYGVVSQSGEGSDFDGNGEYLRVQTGGGAVFAESNQPGVLPPDDVLWARTIKPPQGTQPVLPSSRPPLRPDVACHTNQLPDLNGPAAAVGPPSPRQGTPPGTP